MQYLPHEYQSYATSFIETHPESAMFLDMGLGKTVITLTALNNLLFDYFDAHKILVIAPLRVGANTWPSEIAKWDHLKNLKVSVAIANGEKNRLKAFEKKADIYIINRENVEWLVKKVEEKVLRFDYDTIVIDELSSFKNGRAKRFKALLKCRPYIKRIIGLTGTPAPNSLMDLWAEYRLLDKGQRLGKFITNYRQEYFREGAKKGNIVFKYIPLPGAEELIYEQIADMTISMRALDHLNMPQLVKSEYRVRLSSEDMKCYRTFARDLAIEIKDKQITAANAAVLTNKLIQVANGAVYIENSVDYTEIHDKKLDALEALIEGANGKPVLVAYWFKHDLDRIMERLSQMEDVTFNEIKTPDSIKEWNNGEIQVGLIHPLSAGHGLNLQEGGSTIIWYSQCFSLEAYEQTNARLYRQGQKDNVVSVIHIVAEDTIDEKVLKVLDGKATIQDALIDAVKACTNATPSQVWSDLAGKKNIKVHRDYSQEGCERLAAAIVKSAVDEYRDAGFKIKDLEYKVKIGKLSKTRTYQEKINDLMGTMRANREYFHSQSFHHLTQIDTDWLLETLNQQIAEYDPSTKVK